MCAATTGHLSRGAFEAIVTPAAVGVCPVEDHRASSTARAVTPA